MAMEHAAGIYLAYPPLVRPYQMRWTCMNTSDKAWTSRLSSPGAGRPAFTYGLIE